MIESASKMGSCITPLKVKETILLALCGRTLYGMEILARVVAASDGAIALKVGSLYPVLRQLEREDKFVEGTDKNSDGKARRRYYCLTDAGKQYLDELEDFRKQLRGDRQENGKA